ncbi:mucin-19 [Pogona vitticeps]
MQLYASLPAKKYTNTRGLCGSFNNKAEDDFMSSQNILEVTSEAFASSWEMMTCPKARHLSCTSIEKENFAKEHCAVLIDPSGVFAPGHFIVDHRTYYERCLISTCVCEKVMDCLCTALGNYVKACAKHGIYITDWRNGICAGENCEDGKVFHYDAKACNTSCRSFSEWDLSCDVTNTPVDGCVCPEGRYANSKGICVKPDLCDCYLDDMVLIPGQNIQMGNYTCICRRGQVFCHNLSDLKPVNCTGGAEFVSCSDPKAKLRVDEICSGLIIIPPMSADLSCRPGCYCPLGLVRDSEGKCIPRAHCPCSYSGRKYEQGGTINIECNTCKCVEGSWICTRKKCQSACHLYGDGQIQTFDGKWYSYDGLCQYVLAEDYCGKEKGSFRILTESVPCCEDGVTCSRKITVVLKDGNLVLQDGKFMFVKDAASIAQCKKDEDLYTVHTVGLYLVIHCIDGITLIWDKNTRVSIIADPSRTGETCGLCGNQNGNLQDEFTTRLGSLAAGPVEFGNSWKTSPTCSDTVAESFPCDGNAYCRDWAVRKCEIIRDFRFRACHSQIDPTPYHKACIEEACACSMEGKYLGFCTAVAMYAEACSAVGICISWRTPDLCPVFCDYYNAPGECSWHYEPCGTVKAKTCKDHLVGRILPSVLEGCYAKCPDHAPYLDENTMKCVRLSDCTCYHKNIILPGQVIYDDCGRLCVCKAGELDCSVFPGVPRAGGVPHFRTETTSRPTTRLGPTSTVVPGGKEFGVTTENTEAGRLTEAMEHFTTESLTYARTVTLPSISTGISGRAFKWSTGATSRSTEHGAVERATEGSKSVTTKATSYVKASTEVLPGPITGITSSSVSWQKVIPTSITEHSGVESSTEGIENVTQYAKQRTTGPYETVVAVTSQHGFPKTTENHATKKIPLVTTGFRTSPATGGSSTIWPHISGETTNVTEKSVTEYTGSVQEGSSPPSLLSGRPGECLPLQESISCRFKNKSYEVGETFRDPDNPCLNYTCTAEGFTTKVKECVKQNWCSKKFRMYRADNCCYDCINVCRPAPVEVGVTANGCRGVIVMAKCTGECKNAVLYGDVDRQMVNKCSCCKAKEHVYKNIPIVCPDGRLEEYRYKHTISCSCQACEGS